MSIRLRVSDIWKSYGGVSVLKGCSYSFSHNGIYVLMGPNGSGKSTFLRLCALLEEPDRGNVLYEQDGRTLPHDIALKRKITLVLPKVGIFNTSVYKNVTYGLRIRGLAREDIRERGNRYLEVFGLHRKKNQNALTLSSGETQRLGIARAMATEPDILFLDEPTASVDNENRALIEEVILGMRQKGSPLVLMTTHDSEQAKKLADILIMIDDGRISPAE